MKLLVIVTTTAVVEEDENHPDFAMMTDQDFKERSIIKAIKEMWENEVEHTTLVTANEVNNVQVFKLPEPPATVSLDELENL